MVRLTSPDALSNNWVPPNVQDVADDDGPVGSGAEHQRLVAGGMPGVDMIVTPEAMVLPSLLG